MASATFNIDKVLEFNVPITFFNPVNPAKKATTELIVDTGNWSMVPSPAVKNLGLDNNTAIGQLQYGGNTHYLHKVFAQVGTLKPVTMYIYVGPQINTSTSKPDTGLFGRANNGLSNWILDINYKTITFSEYDAPYSIAGRKPSPVATFNITNQRVNPSFKHAIKYGNVAYHPVTFFNVKTGAPVKIDMLIDTGAPTTILPKSYIEMLGLDEKNLEPYEVESQVKGVSRTDYYGRNIKVQIGNLKPITVAYITFSNYGFGDTNYHKVLGTNIMYQYLIRFTKDIIRYQEYPPSTSQAAYANVYAYYVQGVGRNHRNRI